jgi:hypothetical protein
MVFRLILKNDFRSLQNSNLLETDYQLEFYINDKIHAKCCCRVNELPMSLTEIIPSSSFCYLDNTILLLIEGRIFKLIKIR